VARGKIHRKIQGAALGFEEEEIAESLANNPLINEGHQAGVFRRIEKLARRDESLHRMLPTKQSLEADNLLRIDLKNWLVKKAKLAAVEGSAKIGFELQTIESELMHGGIEEFRTISTHGLGAPEGRFGIRKECIRAWGRASGESTANADVGANLTLFKDEGRGYGRLNAFSNAKHVARIGAGLEQNCELIPTEARENHVAGSFFGRTGNSITGPDSGG